MSFEKLKKILHNLFYIEQFLVRMVLVKLIHSL